MPSGARIGLSRMVAAQHGLYSGQPTRRPTFVAHRPIPGIIVSGKQHLTLICAAAPRAVGIMDAVGTEERRRHVRARLRACEYSVNGVCACVRGRRVARGGFDRCRQHGPGTRSTQGTSPSAGRQ